MEPKSCPYCKSAEVFYGEYDTFSDTTFSGIRLDVDAATHIVNLCGAIVQMKQLKLGIGGRANE